ALSLPTEDAVRVALRTQQVLAYETGVADTIDPLAGSYFVEALTDELERRAQEYIAKIDELGGSVRAIELGYIQREIEDAAYRYQRELEEQQRIVVGVNRFQVADETRPDLLRVDPELGRRQAAQLAALRSARDNGAVGAALAALEEAARGTANLLPRIIHAVEHSATLGEISDTLRRVFGEQRDERTL
ncbi:MAG TPA: methylmalonyl-CoA mutase family protein, partial [Ktedonobacterales bacterium]|nr:methylmalonyl-CoA mutase family protein [Ktedonobacterales bacterium]